MGGSASLVKIVGAVEDKRPQRLGRVVGGRGDALHHRLQNLLDADPLRDMGTQMTCCFVRQSPPDLWSSQSEGSCSALVPQQTII